MLAQETQGALTTWDRLARWGNVLRYYRPRQLVRRGWESVRPRALTPRPQRLTGPIAVRGSALGAFLEIAQARIPRSSVPPESLERDLAQGTFTLLGEKKNLGTPIDWAGRAAPHPSRLWGFQLHYQEYLLDLAASVRGGDSEAGKIVWGTIASWIAENPPEAWPGSDAWHPYCVSRRLPIWAQLYALSPPQQTLEGEFLKSFTTQAAWLSRALEFDLGGNHLLENLHALALAGCFIEGARAEKWLELAERHLHSELTQQVLPTGEHFERAPMYHCQVLGNLLQVGIAARDVHPTLAELCLTAARKMSAFLHAILHPDGEIPLFGDSCFGEVYSVAELRTLEQIAQIDSAASETRGTSVVGNYWTWRQDQDALIFDAGEVGAPSLPAHAHCDLLNFEASVSGERWFVDSGVFDYADSSMRHYCRSSLAHNGVTVANQNSCDIWSRFRMGSRGRIQKFVHGQQGSFAWCFASQDGYRSQGVPELGRLLVAHGGGAWACVDYVESLRSLSPLQSGALAGRLHLAPEMRVEPRGTGQLELKLHDTVRWLNFPEGTRLDIEQGWYCDRFGKRTRTQVITYVPDAASILFGWWLEPSAENACALSFSAATGVQVRFVVGGKVFEWEFGGEASSWSVS